MDIVSRVKIFFLLSFFLGLFSSGLAQNLFNDEYMLVQYFQEIDNFRNVMHFQVLVDGDTSGVFEELYPVGGEPDTGSFTYHLNEDRSFTIFDEDEGIPGIIDDQGDVFTVVAAGSDFALFGVGVRKSSGRTISDLAGEYWISEFYANANSQAVGFDYADFDGSGNATLYRIDNSVGELDTIDFAYTVDDDGTVSFDDFLFGTLSPDGQFFVAAGAEEDGGSCTYVMGIKKSSGLDNSILNGGYIYNQVQTESDGLSEESAFFAGVNFDGEGMGELVMFLGEAVSDTFDYDIQSDGSLEADTTLGAVSSDGRYFFNVELEDTSSVAFGLGIKGGDFSTSVQGDHENPSPALFKLDQNYPNPFNPTTKINYELQFSNRIDLSIYNLLGQKVATLASGFQAAGKYQVEWDASGFANGVYYYQLRTDAGFIQTRKLVLLK